MKLKKLRSRMLAVALATSVALSGPMAVFANEVVAVSQQDQKVWEDFVDEMVNLFADAESQQEVLNELNNLKNGNDSMFGKLYDFLTSEEKNVLAKYGLDLDSLQTVLGLIKDGDLSANDLAKDVLKDKINANKEKIEDKLNKKGITVAQVKNKLAQFNTIRTFIKNADKGTYAFLEYKEGTFTTTPKLGGFIEVVGAIAGNNEILSLINEDRINEVIAKFNEEATPAMKTDMLKLVKEYGLVVDSSTTPGGGGGGGGGTGGGGTGGGGGGGGGGATTSPSAEAQKDITKGLGDLSEKGADVSAIITSILKDISKLDAAGAKAQAGPIIASMVDVITNAEDAANIKQAQDAMVDLVQALVSRVTTQDVELKEGNATLSASKVAEQIKAAEDIISQLAKAAEKNKIELTKSVKMVLSFELDKEVNDVAVSIPEGLWKAIDKKANIAIRANGVELMLEHNTFKEQVYTMNVKQDGSIVELTTDATFAKPIAVTFAVDKSVKNYPVVYQIIGDSNVVVGGTYDVAAGTVKALLSHFSLYTVKEGTPNTFWDLGDVTWQRKAINELSARGYITGKSETSFDPNANITRAEFATMLTRVLPTIQETGKVGFSDMKEGKWYYNSVVTAVNQGWLFGRDGNKFDPEASITRQEVAVVISRILAQKGYLATTGGSEGLNVAPWAKDAVSLYLREVETKEVLALDMSEAATRAEVAVMIYELLNK